MSYTHARKLYPSAEIHGSGDYGSVSHCHEQVHIELGSEEFVREVSQGPCGKGCSWKHRVERMFPTPLPNIRETAEDRYEERLRAKRESRAE